MPYLIIFFLEFLIIFKLSRILLKKLFKFFYKISKNERFAIKTIALLFLPGTFIHEVSHFLFALFLLVPTGKLELVPEINVKDVKMGSLEIAKTDILRRNLIGIAPMIIGVSVVIALIYLVTQNKVEPIYVVLASILIFQISNTMYSSKKDLELALPLILIISIIALIFYLVKIKIPINLFDLINTLKLASLFQSVDKYLIFPIFLNSVFVLILR